MTPAEAALDHFISNLLHCDKTDGGKRSKILRRYALRDAKNSCDLCLADYSERDRRGLYVTSPLLPHLGGRGARWGASLVICSSCARKRARQDILEPTFLGKLGGSIPEKALMLRMEALMDGANHLTPHWPRAPKEKIRGHLRARHAFPRFRVFAHDDPKHPIIGWKHKDMHPQDHGGAAVLLQHRFSSERVPHPTLVLYRLPEDTYLDAIWALIEMNALVRPIQTIVTRWRWEEVHPHDWRRCWRSIFKDKDDIIRRYERGNAGKPEPWAPRVPSQSRAARSMRKRKPEREARELRLHHRCDYNIGQREFELFEIHSADPVIPNSYLRRMRDEAIWLMSTPHERKSLLLRDPNWPRPPEE